MVSSILLVSLPVGVASHGRMTFPRNRMGGTLAVAGTKNNCDLGTNSGGLSTTHNSCGYQSRLTTISGPTNCNCAYTTGNMHSSCPSDGDCSKVDKTRVAWTMPWAAPGKAKVWSACGVNGGYPDASTGSYAEPRDGRDLPQTASSKWVMGETAEVAFTITKHHGGGYQWRLCPGASAGSRPSDSCFQAHPLKFATSSTTVRWTDGREQKFKALQPPGSAVTPQGSDWRVIQIPITKAYKEGWRQPPCDGCHGHWGVNGDDIKQEWEFSLLDHVYVPTDIPSGHAWLQWRWDNEQQDQVWTSCADIEIVSPPSPSPSPAPSPASSDTLYPGSSMNIGDSLLSKSGNARLTLQQSGNLVLKDEKTGSSLWKSDTSSSTARLNFHESDGNLVVKDADGNTLWRTGVLPGAVRMKLQDDCNLVIRDAGDNSLWSTKTSCSATLV